MDVLNNSWLNIASREQKHYLTYSYNQIKELWTMVFQNNVVVFSFIFFLNAMKEQQLFGFKETKEKKCLDLMGNIQQSSLYNWFRLVKFVFALFEPYKLKKLFLKKIFWLWCSSHMHEKQINLSFVAITRFTQHSHESIMWQASFKNKMASLQKFWHSTWLYNLDGL